MDDLFDQLKSSAGPTKTKSSPVKTFANSTKLHKATKTAGNGSNKKTTLEDFNRENKSNPANIRRESLPSPPTFAGNIGTKKAKSQKARSLSPPKFSGNTGIKSLKVKLERKKIEEFLTRPLEEHANNIRAKQNKNKDVKQTQMVTPTKAQQKQFEPLKHKKTKAQILKDFKIKSCKVRIHRDNLQQLAKNFNDKNSTGTSKAIKRSATSSTSGSPPPKKGKASLAENKSAKPKNNFFIKFTTSPSSKLEKKLKNITKISSPSSSNSSSSVAHHNKIRNAKSSTNITTPTKFSRSQLIGSFGKRFFNVQVKIERCTHPLMLTFESNDRARRLQAKRNKSKNLSVSFREQVEIFGSESDDSYDEDFCAAPNRPNNRKSNGNQSIPVPVAPVVMPARLKKVENGKVVDDIELDPSLFLDPKSLVASTPFSPLRKKRDHNKSFSPLKDESSPSPRKEQLKLANERVPPSGLRRLNIDDEDDDDDCEYIVPIELPERRGSRTSSNASLDDIISSSILPLEDSATDFSALFNSVGNALDINFGAEKKDENNVQNSEAQKPSLPSTEANHESGSSDSFQSAKDILPEKGSGHDAVVAKINDNQMPSLRVSVDSEKSKTNGNCSAAQSKEKKQNADTKSKHLNTVDTMDDISMNLFLEDSQTNDDNQAKSIVDSLINETIDKLTKEIDENGGDKQLIKNN